LDKEEPLVHGIVAGRLMTLVDAQTSGFQLTVPGIATQTLGARAAFEHVHLSERGPHIFDRATLRLPDLKAWSGVRGVTMQDVEPDGFSVRYRRPEPMTAQYGGFTITLRGTYRHDFGRSRTTIDDEVELAMQSASLLAPEEWVEHAVRPMQDLLTFITGRPNTPLSLHLMSPQVEREPGKRQPVEVLYLEDAEPPQDDLSIDEALFLLPRLPTGYWSDLVPRWLALRVEQLDSISLLLSARYAGRASLSARFLNLWHSLEAFHRTRNRAGVIDEAEHEQRVASVLANAAEAHRAWLKMRLEHSNDHTSAQRLGELLGVLGKAFDEVMGKRSRFIRCAVDTRNYFTHWDPDLRQGAANGEDLYRLNLKLELLLDACLMVELGINREAATQVVRDQYVRRSGRAPIGVG
jgi:hypothetical protein